MLEQDLFALTEPEHVRRLISGHGWATLITAADGVPVVSHLPVLAEERETGPGLAVVGHLARTDAEAHGLGAHESVLVVQGPHGYVSPSMYGAGTHVPTWNFVVVHLHGRPELLDAEATYEVLRRTVDHFEQVRQPPWRLETVTTYARALAPHTAGFRLVPDRVAAKRKLSQDKPRDLAARVADALADPGDAHHNPALADAMRKVLMPRV